MASVWVHDKKRARKLKGHMSMNDALKHFKMLIHDWRVKGGKTKMVDGMEAVMISPEGKVICGLYVEPYSPPSAAEPGQPKRVQA